MLAITADRLISSYCSHPNPYYGIVVSGRLFAWASQQQHHLR